MDGRIFSLPQQAS